tara:strand:+ start:796 stop:954 length:159 start_codon:yes stop_codon:yes gene_type:complete
MNFTDIKIYALNGSSLMISFTNIETVFKLVLLGVSIGYTLHKWWLMDKNKDE